MEIEDLLSSPAQVMPRLKVSSKKQALQDLARAPREITGVHERADLRCSAGARASRHHRRRQRHRHPARQARRREEACSACSPGSSTPSTSRRSTSSRSISSSCCWRRKAPGPTTCKALARVSRLLRDRAICEKLRGADQAEAITPSSPTAPQPPPRARRLHNPSVSSLQSLLDCRTRKLGGFACCSRCFRGATVWGGSLPSAIRCCS